MEAEYLTVRNALCPRFEIMDVNGGYLWLASARHRQIFE